MSSKYLEYLFKCHSLTKEIIEIKHDVFGLPYDFPSVRWEFLLFFRTNVFMQDISDELLEVKNLIINRKVTPMKKDKSTVEVTVPK